MFFNRMCFVQTGVWRATYSVDNSYCRVGVASWSEFIDLFAENFPSKKWLVSSCQDAMAKVNDETTWRVPGPGYNFVDIEIW